ncbi:uncharacterized protein LOC103572158 isoform X2 [Microplitis demolitor]|uniref:uncharacterized protein LOC103572158 isoform X2 n=1 Tax=Microplitis demolitor TaxID=69319 RepID=UPI0004CD8936|nr:uncharacterized protein LOC103572158 isoform X2 [Microplitis demolitor]XP_053598928.1 uncharacterized protein LOC103572158 isoform X2 [Microplitis demolitor]XP_053598929.1 uncharacterized protein LOC103572158 isoform X2 [Microplitis demolitor]
MPQCAVATCRNSHRRTRGRRIRYHRFPQIPEVRARWVRACGRAPLSNGEIPFNIQTARICSLHFTNDSYEKDMEHLVLGLPVRSRLRRGAVPTIGVPVNVQPVTKMLVEEAKRSILKVTNNKIISERNSKIVAGNDSYYNPGNRQSKNTDEKNKGRGEDDDVSAAAAGRIYDYGSQDRRNNFEQKMAGMDVLLALGLKPASRLNKMHAMECASSPGNKTVNDKKDDTTTGDSPKVPQNRQNGAALPEETTTPASVTTGRVKVERLANSLVKKERQSDDEDCNQVKKKSRTVASKETRKRRSTDETSFSTNGNPKRICFEQRERFIDSLVGCDRITAEELATRADELRAEVQALDELARAKEMEWNEILSMRKLKEEAYLRVERKRQVMGYLENNNGQISDSLPPASLSLMPEWAESHREASQERRAQETPSATEVIHDERVNSRSRIEASREDSQTMEEDISPAISKGDDEVANLSQKSSRNSSGMSSKHNQQQLIDGRKQRRSAAEQNLDNRQIGEGRQGPIVDVRSIIADYRLRHPETVPRRGRRMRNSVNVNLGAGGAMVETSHGDSRPSSTDSCKSNSNIGDVNNPMSFKDVLVQFAKLSQQQGEPVKTPQNYPDVTLHPVAPTSVTINPAAPTQQTGSLLHGILTKNQTPRPTTFSPTLARLLTAPERERNSAATAAVMSQQITHGQNLLQAYQGTNPVSISDLLSSSKARTEITITPVVNTQMPSTHLNNVVHVDDVEEDNSLIDERDTRRGSSARDNREDRDTPPRCQGCHDRAAQFVCAGCGNQWYCSRECQVSAWDEHSEVCSG